VNRFGLPSKVPRGRWQQDNRMNIRGAGDQLVLCHCEERSEAAILTLDCCATVG